MHRTTPSPICDARTSVLASWTLRTATTLAVALTCLATSTLAAPVKTAQQKRQEQLMLDPISLVMQEAATWSRYDRHVLRYHEPLQIFWAAEVTRTEERSGQRFSSPPCLSRAIERDQAYASLELNEHGQKICVVPLAPPKPRLQPISGQATPKVKAKFNKIVDRTRSSAARVVALAGARSPKSSVSTSTQTWIRGTCKETAEKFDVSEEDCVQVSVVRDSCRISGTKHPCRSR